MSAVQSAKIAVSNSNERRASFREKRNLSIGVIVTDPELPNRDCTIIDVGMAGARIMVPNPYDLPDQFTLVDPKRFVAHEANVVWRRGVLAGISFCASCFLDEENGPQIAHLRARAVEKATVSSF